MRNLVRLAKLTGDNRYADAARQTLEVFAAQLESSPAGHAYLAIGLAEYLTAFGDGAAPGPLANPPAPTKPPTPQPPTPPAPQTKEPQWAVFAHPTAEETQKHPLIQGEASIAEGAFQPGAKCPVMVTLQVKKGWHINANPARPKNVKATELTAVFTGGSTLGAVVYPKGVDLMLEGVDEPLSVYEGTVQLKTTIDVPENFTGQESVTLTIRYQACNEKECHAPAKLVLTGVLK